LSLSAIP